MSAREQAAFREDPAPYVAPASRPDAMESKMGRPVKGDQMEGPRVGLEGYCPVCILDANKWAKGSPEHQATYDGVTYYFPEEAIKGEKFLASPAKYVPALGGDCIVCYAKLGECVPGMINHTVRVTTTGCSCSPAPSSNGPSWPTRRSSPTPTWR